MKKLALFLFFLFHAVPAMAGTFNSVPVDVKESDKGLWGTELRACHGRISANQCAKVLPLVMDDNGITFAHLNHIPVGKRILVRKAYLVPGFRVSAKVLARARQIFPDLPVPKSTSTSTATVNKTNVAQETPAVLETAKPPAPTTTTSPTIDQTQLTKLKEENDRLKRQLDNAQSSSDGWQKLAMAKGESQKAIYKAADENAEQRVDASFGLGAMVGGGIVALACWFFGFRRKKNYIVASAA